MTRKAPLRGRICIQPLVAHSCPAVDADAVLPGRDALLGRNDVAKLLAMTLKEEKATDKKLNDIAKRKINKKALARKPKKLTVEEKLEEALIGIPPLG